MSLPPPFVLKSDKTVLTEDGTRILFVKPVKDMDGAVEYFKAKMLVGDAIRGAKDGIYTWLLKEGGLAVIPVESEQELVQSMQICGHGLRHWVAYLLQVN